MLTCYVCSTEIGEISDISKCFENFVSQTLGVLTRIYAAELRVYMNLREIFVDKLKIESKVVTIDSLFDDGKVKKTQYAPPYQRNYVWDGEKATYFIESILIGTEIPPLIFFRSRGSLEIIDGRQRYETILRFLRGELRLSKSGLKKLDGLKIYKKTFESLPTELKNDFWDTKLRINRV